MSTAPRPQGQSVPPRPPRRTRYPDLSPTRNRVLRRDESQWPDRMEDWTDLPVEMLAAEFILGFPTEGEA